MNLHQSLEALGMSDKESKVYLACLEVGNATANQISTKSGISRSTTYFLLDGLASKGFVSYLDKGKVRHYAAEGPDFLLKRGKQNLSAVEKGMPELQRLWRESTSDQPRVRYFRGLNNIKRMYDELLDLRWKNYLVFGSVKFWAKTDKEWFWDYMKRRSSAGVHVKLIVEDSPEAREQQEVENKLGGTEVKFVPPNFTQVRRLTSDVTVLPDRVIFQNYGRDMTSTVLHSRESADLMRLQHEMLWKMLWRV